jgi:hypothetical protein
MFHPKTYSLLCPMQVFSTKAITQPAPKTQWRHSKKVIYTASEMLYYKAQKVIYQRGHLPCLDSLSYKDISQLVCMVQSKLRILERFACKNCQQDRFLTKIKMQTKKETTRLQLIEQDLLFYLT